MTADELLTELRAHGVTVRPDNGGLELEAKHAPPAELLQALKEHKAELLGLLEQGAERQREREREAERLYSLAACLPQRRERIRTLAAHLIAKYRVIYLDMGSYAIINAKPHHILEALEAYEWGVITTTEHRILTKWGSPPLSAYPVEKRGSEKPFKAPPTSPKGKKIPGRLTLMSGAKHRRKGDRLERQLVTILKDHGIAARRVPLSGSVAGYPGDVIVTLAGRELILECKSRKSFKTLYGWLEARDALILKGDRQEPLVVTRLADLLTLYQRRPS